MNQNVLGLPGIKIAAIAMISSLKTFVLREVTKILSKNNLPVLTYMYTANVWYALEVAKVRHSGKLSHVLDFPERFVDQR